MSVKKQAAMNASKFIVNGGTPLKGEVVISGAKNSAVGIIPATILCDEECIISNVPDISDIQDEMEILRGMGAKITRLDSSAYKIDTTGIKTFKVSDDAAHNMRASTYFMGTLLGRFKEAIVPAPGGCNLGDRPIDLHLKAFEQMGAKNSIDNGSVHLKADYFISSGIRFDQVSVGATINAMYVACKAGEGIKTVIENAAKEPHVVDVANFLNSMGAKITGAGTDKIKIVGVDFLHGTDYSIIPDQIEAGTFMVAAAATKGKIKICNVTTKHLETITEKLRQTGVFVDDSHDDYVIVDGSNENLKPCNVVTLPHPGFPTDMQPQFSTLLTLAKGASVVTDNIFSNRFKYVEQLRKMGAEITVTSSAAVINGHGFGSLKCANNVRAVDLRAGAAMVIAALSAKGETTIGDVFHIQRGYEDIVGKLKNLGADIKIVYDENPQNQNCC